MYAAMCVLNLLHEQPLAICVASNDLRWRLSLLIRLRFDKDVRYFTSARHNLTMEIVVSTVGSTVKAVAPTASSAPSVTPTLRYIQFHIAGAFPAANLIAHISLQCCTETDFDTVREIFVNNVASKFGINQEISCIEVNGSPRRIDIVAIDHQILYYRSASVITEHIDYAGSMVSVASYFSCAAQQLNVSQSTHRFSFVNHTIKTVNMPKVRHSVNLKSKLTSYISEFKEDGLSTDNKILFCNLCQCAVSSTQKFLVQQHITTSKHQANKQLNSKQRQLFLTQPTTSNVRSEFNIDLCRSLISADIPLYKLKNKVFREFLEKYTQHTIPDESTLRKTYAPSIYDETIQKIRDEIKDSSIWVSIDETPDKEGRLVGNVVIGLLNKQYK
ncbi:hypothetical protein ANN_23292 [Periplaneta americana]|uniref:Uncharacterized protein n=1 Tax=Periplaneta americana TaxID=6978 RepID=A0ABQ8SKP5_PERAM|nr:hypothetical protein ANN_23292 [Periplaneta americana]